MPKGARYPSPQIDEQDKEYIDNSITNFIVLHSVLISKYPDPQKFALKIAKLLELKKTKLNLYTVLFILDELKGNIIKPEHLRNYLTNKLVGSQPDLRDTGSVDCMSNGIDSRDLRQYVLKNFENYGYIQNYQGKEKNKELMKNNRGRPSLSAAEDHGGNPSIYKLDNRVEYFRCLINKSDGIDYLFDKLHNNKFFKEVLKYQIKVYYYLVGLTDNTLLQPSMFTSEFFKMEKPQETEHIVTNQIIVNAIDDNKIDILTDLYMTFIKIHKEQYCTLVLSLGLIAL